MSDDRAKLITGVAIDFYGETIQTSFVPQESGTIICTFKYDEDTDAILLYSPRCYLGYTDGAICGCIGDDSPTVIKGTTLLSFGTFYRAAIRWDSNGVSLFLSGHKEYSGAKNGNVSVDPFIIGGASGVEHKDLLSNIQVFNRALTDEELIADANTCFSDLNHAFPDAWWLCLEGIGNYLYDWSLNGYDCDMVGWPDDSSHWRTKLETPFIPQAALFEWEQEFTSKKLLPINPVTINNKFFRAYGELNFDRRGYADAGDTEDIKPSTALVFELVCDIPPAESSKTLNTIGKINAFLSKEHIGDPQSLEWFVYCASGEKYIIENTVTDHGQHHYLFVYDSRTSTSQLFVDGVIELEEVFSPADPLIKQTTNEFQIATFGSYSDYYFGQMSTISVYIDDLAQQLIDQGMPNIAMQMFNKARETFPLGNILPESDIALWDISSVSTDYGYGHVTLNGTDYAVFPNESTPVTEGESYIYRFWAQLGAFDIANYAIYDVTNSSFIVPETDYSSQLNHNDMTMIDVTFIAPAGCVEILASPFHGSGAPAEILLKRPQAVLTI